MPIIAYSFIIHHHLNKPDGQPGARAPLSRQGSLARVLSSYIYNANRGCHKVMKQLIIISTYKILLNESEGGYKK
jgi:hypothetical protein